MTLKIFHLINQLIVVAEVEGDISDRVKLKRGVQLMQQAVRGQNGQPEIQVQFAPIGMPLNADLKGKLKNLELNYSNVMYSYDLDESNPEHRELKQKYDSAMSSLIMPNTGIATR